MNRNTSKLVKILLALFALNSLSLYLYFSHSHSQNHHSHDNLRFSERSYLRLPHHFSKAWPILPSYLPWSQNPKARFRSCEAYFGNGFTTRVDLLPSSTAGNGGGGGGAGGGGWFRCFYSETLRSSICEGGKLKMNHEKIAMSKGGERIEDVIGRRDEEELPEYQNGAFQIEGDGVMGFRGKRVGKRLVNDDFLNRHVPRGGIDMHTMRGLIGSIELVDSKVFDQCEQWIEEPTLLVTRFEYANVFHTFTDWYSAYVSSRVTGLPNRPHVVFVDGHSRVFGFSLHD